MILDDKAFNSNCFDILHAMWCTRQFSSREPKKDKPTAPLLLAQSHLLNLYNGIFISSLPLIDSDKKKFKNDHLDALKGNWDLIHKTVVSAIPSDFSFPTSYSLDKFFWNDNSQKSLFLNRAVINEYETRVVGAGEMKMLRGKEVKGEAVKCGEVMCPKYEKCKKANLHNDPVYAVGVYMYNENGCAFFEEDLCRQNNQNEGLELDLS